MPQQLAHLRIQAADVPAYGTLHVHGTLLPVQARHLQG